MKPAKFELHQPTTLEEALSILAETCEDGGLILAGGQSLVPMMALRVAYPPHLIDINGIAALSEITEEDGHLLIGATARHARFHQPVEPGCLGQLLATVSRNIAHYPIRMRGTFCGSLAHCDPSSEWCLVTATLDGEIQLASTEGARSLEPGDYFLGAMMTSREPNEILTGVRLPLLGPQSRFGFYEFSRRAGDFAIGSSLVVFDLVDGLMTNVRVGLGGIEETPRRIPEAEAILEGQAPDDAIFEQAGQAAATVVEPMEDATTTADYRRDLTVTVIQRALQNAIAGKEH